MPDYTVTLLRSRVEAAIVKLSASTMEAAADKARLQAHTLQWNASPDADVASAVVSYGADSYILEFAEDSVEVAG